MIELKNGRKIYLLLVYPVTNRSAKKKNWSSQEEEPEELRKLDDGKKNESGKYGLLFHFSKTYFSQLKKFT